MVNVRDIDFDIEDTDIYEEDDEFDMEGWIEDNFVSEFDFEEWCFGAFA